MYYLEANFLIIVVI